MIAIKRSLLVCGVLLLGLASGQERAVSGELPRFCEPRLLRDYAAPLKHLPKARRFPNSGKLPFGPAWLRLYGVSGTANHVIVTGSGMQYAFEVKDATHGRGRVDWLVTTQLVRVNRRGRPAWVAKRRRQYVRGRSQLRGFRIGFAKAAMPGLFRYDVVFRDRSGRILGRYYDYFRVVQRSTAARLRFNKRQFQPGEPIVARFENYTPEWLKYGAEYWVERRYGDRWRHINLEEIVGSPVDIPSVAYLTMPGVSGRCMRLWVLEMLGPGLYRVSKSVDFNVRRSAGRIGTRRIFGGFIIAPTM